LNQKHQPFQLFQGIEVKDKKNEKPEWIEKRKRDEVDLEGGEGEILSES
jgi:hypothetical protein